MPRVVYLNSTTYIPAAFLLRSTSIIFGAVSEYSFCHTNWPAELNILTDFNVVGCCRCQIWNVVWNGLGSICNPSAFRLAGSVRVFRFTLSINTLLPKPFLFLNTTCNGPVGANAVRSIFSFLHWLGAPGKNSNCCGSFGLPIVCRSAPYFL